MGILSGIRVLDLSRILSGPYITMSLGDMGADVVKVEEPGRGDDTRHWGPPFIGQDSTYFLAINRNKRSIAVNLKDPEGQRIVYDLARHADVVVENFRASTRDRLGLDYPTLRQVNPRLVVLHISAFGETGPYADKPGYDLLAQASGGLMSLTGEPDGPPVKAGFAMADLGAAMFGLTGILAALFHRERTGEGQYLTTSLYETQLAFHINWAGNYFATGETPRAMGSAHPNLAPYQAYRAADGHLVIACGNDALWQRLCDAFGRPEWKSDPRYVTNAARVQHRLELEHDLEAQLSTQPVAHWVAALEDVGVPAGPILNLADIYGGHPQTEALGMVQTVDHPVAGPLQQVAFPVHFAATPARMTLPPPLVGEHTDAILRELGRTDEEIAQLRDHGVVA
ncbi:MAG: CoA transferase [Alicyclobacillus sp.]|nr:CoA transferase [Alicyclobacillus sp.]